MDKVVCPGCGEEVSLRGVKAGDRIDCPNCANLTLRLKEENGRYFLVEIPQVSCPTCDRLIEVSEDLRPGDILTCCGEDFLLTYEFGAYALREKSAKG